MRIRTVVLAAGLGSAVLAEPSLDERAAPIRPTAAERRWRLVPMLDSLEIALARAKEQNKPVYYFGADGVLDSGNC